MGESLTQRRRVGEEGFRVVNLFCRGRRDDGTRRISPEQLRVSTRGNTWGASVVRIYWA
jgi:hypothetical protein